MATITRRGAGWYVQVRRKGYPASFRTFATKRQATAWAAAQEAILASFDGDSAPQAPTMAVGELLKRYLVSVLRSDSSQGFAGGLCGIQPLRFYGRAAGRDTTPRTHKETHSRPALVSMSWWGLNSTGRMLDSCT
jgi:hypothetical protein